jgi:ribonuclease P protein component|tara:strand:+ start:1274 stop:1618 length:345 start_codon:yes stop_codon:yes gene_type:complete
MKSKIIALSKNEDFKSLLKKKKISNKYITLFFGTLADKDISKLNISFVAKKKLIRSAVKRNKVKRRLRNIMNEAINKISINFNYSYLVIAKITMLNNEYAIIKDTLFQDIKKIK